MKKLYYIDPERATEEVKVAKDALNRYTKELVNVTAIVAYLEAQLKSRESRRDECKQIVDDLILQLARQECQAACAWALSRIEDEIQDWEKIVAVFGPAGKAIDIGILDSRFCQEGYAWITSYKDRDENGSEIMRLQDDGSYVGLNADEDSPKWEIVEIQK